MTKEKIIEIMQQNLKLEIEIAELQCEIFYNFDEIADELLAEIEQEKKDAIKDVLTRLNITIEAETRPYIEAGTANYDKPIRAFCVERSVLDNKIKDLAEEYEVEL